ncbi:MAG: hypothetical protein K0R10_2779 [Alphaproteobacteria bacterium]|jgi:hypothetical protein|nr:hypothetical protein [Alphaproteobacteria bacterium]
MKHSRFLIAAALLIAHSLATPAQAQFDAGLGLYETEGEEAEDSTTTNVTPATSEYRKQHPLDEDHNYGDEGGKDIMADPEEDED